MNKAAVPAAKNKGEAYGNGFTAGDQGAELAACQEERRRLALENEDLRFDVKRLRLSTEQMQQEILALSRELEKAQGARSEIAVLEAQFEIRAAALVGETRAVEEQLNAIRNSTFWSLTRPFRLATDILRQIGKPR